MSIWRAPLLIIGILLVLLAAAALAAPWFIDWNRYRPQLQAWGQALTGREVTIAGDVDFVLFPWPAARLHRVRVAAATGSRFAHLLTVDEVEARFSLGALFGGRLEVESIRLLRPTLALEHMGGGQGNWQLAPRTNVRLPLSPERIAIDTVYIEKGRLLLADSRLRSQLHVKDITARVRAPRLIGPWRVKGAVTLLGRRWRLYLATGEIRVDAPVTLSLRLEPPQDESGLVIRLDGALAPASENAGQPRFAGRLQLHPVLGGKRGNPLDPARQLDVKTKVRLDPTALELTELKIEPRFPARAPFDAVSGRMRMEFGAPLNTQLLLRTTRLRLDATLDRLLRLTAPAGTPAEGLDALRQRLRALARTLPHLPPELLLQLDAQATALEFNGRTYTNAALSAELTRELLTIRHLRADATHGTRLSFRGNLLAGDEVQLTGEMAVKTADARGLLFSLAPNARALLDSLWRGAPGALDLLATMDLTDTSLRLLSRKLAIDGAPASLDWRHAHLGDGRMRNEIALSAEKLDLDAWRGAAGWAQARPLLSPVDVDFRLLADIGTLRLAGLTWKQAHLEALHTPRAMQLDALRAELAGLSLNGRGAFHRAGWGDPWRGDLSIRLKGADATPLWRALSGLAGEETAPDWLRRLGAMDLRLELEASPENKTKAGKKPTRIRARARLHGSAGPANVDVSVKGTSGWPRLADGNWAIRAHVDSPQAAPLLALTRLPVPEREGPLRLSLRADGVPGRNMRVATSLQWPGLQWRYAGDARLPREQTAAFPWLQGSGKATLALADTAWLLRRLALHAPAATPLKGEAELAFSPAHLALRQLKARLGDATTGGEIRLAWPLAEAPAIQARLVTDRADLAALLRLLLAAPDNPVRLRPRIAAGWRTDVELRADTLRLPGAAWNLPNALLRITGTDDNAMRLDLRGGRRGMTLKARAALHRVPLGLQVRGELRAAFPLHRALRTADDILRPKGRARMDLSFTGRTVTLPGFLPVLQGTGTLRFDDGRIEGLSPDRLLRALRRVQDETALKRFRKLVRENLHAGTWPLPRREAQLSLANGMLELLPATYEHAGLTTRLNGLMDPAARRIDVTLEFAERGRQAAPPFSVTLAGPPEMLAVSLDVGLLREWLQERLIQRRMEEIRRLEEQRKHMEERARKLEEEERKRQEQITKQQAEDIISRLEQELSVIRADELRRERETAANPTTPEDRTLRALMQQAREEDKPAIAAAPPPRVAPGAGKTTTGKPRRKHPTPARTDQRRKDTSRARKTVNAKPTPEGKKDKPSRTKPAANSTETPPKSAPKETTAKSPAHATGKPASRQKPGPRVIYKPLTNWNNRSRTPATP